MFIATTDRNGDKHFVTQFDLESARDVVRKLVEQGRDFAVAKDGDTATIWAKHEPEKCNRWWDERIRGFHARENRR